MTDYKKVSDALESGADPAMLCATCPWDRYCLTPPSMTREEVQRQLDQARVKDEAEAASHRAAGKPTPMPIGGLLTAITVGGRDSQAGCCPVFALRLRTSGGRSIVDSLKSSMVSWDDGAV